LNSGDVGRKKGTIIRIPQNIRIYCQIRPIFHEADFLAGLFCLERISKITEQNDHAAMDSKADDCDLFRELKRQRKINLIIRCRKKWTDTMTLSGS
jgi:hypothetical protein